MKKVLDKDGKVIAYGELTAYPEGATVTECTPGEAKFPHLRKANIEWTPIKGRDEEFRDLQRDHAALLAWLEKQHGLSKGQLATLIKGGETK